MIQTTKIKVTVSTLDDIRTAAMQLVKQIDQLNANPDADPTSDNVARERIFDYWNLAGELMTVLIADRIEFDISEAMRQCAAMGTYPLRSNLLERAHGFIDVEVRQALDRVIKAHDAEDRRQPEL